MSFKIENKVVVVTGGASGIGLAYARELLKNAAKGVTIADVNKTVGEQALQQLSLEFGTNKVIFVQADVSDKAQFEEIFKETIKAFKNVDILINNAGILNETIWEKEIETNINGTTNGILLGLEKYIPQYKTGAEGLIVNTSSTAALETIPHIPIYSASKAAILALTTNFGAQVHYERSKVRVIAICPGTTDTPMLREVFTRTLGEEYKKILLDKILREKSIQKSLTPEQMAKCLVTVIEKAEPGSIWVARFEEEPYEIKYLNNYL